ncbi:MAG TPA: hypothetical protein VFQ53_18065 [Kofleriaceae bacterium]|nr:hypothetical protein [Kofleriaceae bacterium]
MQCVVVDSSALGRQTMCACLNELGHHAIAASSSQAAEALIAGGEVDLVVVDHCPPWSDGWALARRLHDRDIAAIVLGDPTDARPITRTLALTRPVSLHDLERAIARLAAEPHADPRRGSM